MKRSTISDGLFGLCLWLLLVFPILLIIGPIIIAAWNEDRAVLARSQKPAIKLISIQHQDCVAVLTSNREVVFQPRTTRADGSIDCYLEDVK
jgi:hypothetical protein